MAKEQSVSYFNFVGGLNTEASPLNMPPTDATEILNIDLSIDGSIQPRRGVDFLGESDLGGIYTTSPTDLTTAYGIYTDPAASVHLFEPLDLFGNIKKFVIVHIGTEIRCYSYTYAGVLRNVGTPYQTIDLSQYGEVISHHRTTFIANKNRLFIVNPKIPFGYIEYDAETTVFTFHEQYVYARNIDDESSSLDTYINNDGMNYKCILSHATASSENEPGKGENWTDYWAFNGEEIAATLYGGDVNEWTPHGAGENTYCTTDNYGDGTGKSWKCKKAHISKSHFRPGYKSDHTADLWERVPFSASYKFWRSGVYYIPGAGDAAYYSNIEQAPTTGWINGCFSSGRLWLVNLEENTKVYFSQSIRKDHHYGRMYQFADPYNHDDSEIVDTDGGTVTITGAGKIYAVEPYQGGVIVLATKGIWYIHGPDSFKPTNFAVDRISEDGVVGPQAYSTIDQGLIYFGTGNVYLISAEASSTSIPAVQPIAEKIRSFYSGLYMYNREASKVVYNSSTKKLYYLCNFFTDGWLVSNNSQKQPTHFRDMLVFDLRIKSWYKFSLSEDTDGTKVYIGDLFTLPGGALSNVNVLDGNGDIVTNDALDTVVAQDPTLIDAELADYVLLIKRSNDSCKFAFGQLESTVMEDFLSSEEDREDFDAHVTLAYQIYNDVIRQKQAPYLTTVFKRMECGVLGEDGVDLTPGGCKMRVDWNWATNSNNGKFGTLKDVYFPYKWNQGYYDGADPGVATVSSKHKILGRGQTLRVYFEKVAGKDFKLYGIQLLIRPKSDI